MHEEAALLLYHINIDGSCSKAAVSESCGEQLRHTKTITIHPEVVSNLAVEGIGGIHSANKVLG